MLWSDFGFCDFLLLRQMKFQKVHIWPFSYADVQVLQVFFRIIVQIHNQVILAPLHRQLWWIEVLIIRNIADYRRVEKKIKSWFGGPFVFLICRRVKLPILDLFHKIILIILPSVHPKRHSRGLAIILIKFSVSIAFIKFFVILWKIWGTWIFLIFWRFAFFFKFFVMKWRFWGFNTIWRLLSIFRFDVVGTMKWLWIWSYRNSLLLLNKLIIDLRL